MSDLTPEQQRRIAQQRANAPIPSAGSAEAANVVLEPTDTAGEMSDRERATAATTAMSTAISAALELCEAGTGYNLGDLLRVALEDVATERGGSHHLVAQRPGSWEAEHVRALAAGADYQ